MKKIRAAVVGYGNIGKYTIQALEAAPDFEIAGVVRRNGAADKPAELAPYAVVKDIKELQDVDWLHPHVRARNMPSRSFRWASTPSIPSTSTPTFAAIASV